MKKLLLIRAAFFAASAALFAQTFIPAPGYLAQELTTFKTDPGFTISGLGTDNSGGVYYFETGAFGGGSSKETRLFTRSTADGFATPTQLFSYGSVVSGNFVKVSGSTVYFGEGSGNFGGTIRSIATNGGVATTIATVPGNYDLAIGSSGAFLSAAASFQPVNKVYKLNLSNGKLDTIVSPTNDYSGPLAVSLSGKLLYGATAFGNAQPGIYSFTSEQVASVTDADPATSDTALPLSAGTRVVQNGNNQYLAYADDAHLFQSDSPFGAPALLKRFDLTLSGSPAGEAVGQTQNGDFFGALAVSGSSLFAVVTSDFSNGPSSVFLITEVPEPSAAMLVVAGCACVFGSRRSRKSCVA